MLFKTANLHFELCCLPLHSRQTTRAQTVKQKIKIAASPVSCAMDFVIGYVSGSIAACGAVTFTNPFEVIKTRLQLQGELARHGTPKPYTNTFAAIPIILKNEGIRGLQKGLGAAYIYQILMNGIRLGSYEPLKNIFRDTLGLHSTLAAISAGSLSGVLGASVASPLFLVKTRIQSYAPSNISVGYQHRYTSVWNGLTSIYKNENGIRGLFKGANAAMARTAVGSGVQLATYDAMKQFILSTGYVEDGLSAYFSASLLTSFIACSAMNPFDVVMTRVYNQARDKHGNGVLYRGLVDCFVKTLKAEGVRGIYKGWLPHYLRLGPHTILTFVFLEESRKLLKRVLTPASTLNART